MQFISSNAHQPAYSQLQAHFPKVGYNSFQSSSKINLHPYHAGGSNQTQAFASRRPSYDQQKFSNIGWRIGQNVLHAKFGTGVIVNCEGSGSDARVQVNFAQAGTKWLLLEYAKLTAI